MSKLLRNKKIWQIAAAAAIAAIAGTAAAGSILGSKHDFTGLNKKAEVAAMSEVAFADYGSPCVYCHVPAEKEGQDQTNLGGIPGWNRFTPATGGYDLYNSRTLDNKVRTPSPISLLCLSCHDGTMGVDMTVFKPDGWDSSKDASLHVRLNGGDSLMNCGKCHNGVAAHSIEIKHIGTDLQNDHPISMEYAGLNAKDPDYRPLDNDFGFDNGVKLYDNRVECATCHNVHNPDVNILLRTSAERLCETCHMK
ncbi:cytochrome c3 family protein [Pseudomonadota bacterium]